MAGMIKFNNTLWLQFTIVGAGANGSNFFRGLCHDLRTHLDATRHNRSFFLDPVMLIDGDKIEEKNLGNQIFEKDEVGEHKTSALANRYGEHYGLDVLSYTEYIQDAEMLRRLMPVSETKDDNLFLPVLVAMVDNNATRQIFDAYFRSDAVQNLIYIDAGVHGVSLDEFKKPRADTGNGGQIIVGVKVNGVIVMEPIGTLYPEVLTDTDSVVPGCGVVIHSAPQRSATNKFAAQLANNIVNTILTEKAVLVHTVNFDSRMNGSRPELVSKNQELLFKEAVEKAVVPV